jgi:hypothetical protein
VCDVTCQVLCNPLMQLGFSCSLVPPDHTTRRQSIFQYAAAKIKQPLKKRHKSKSIGDLFTAPEIPSVPCPIMHHTLEETSLADFLRVVSSLQSRLATPPDTGPPRRKAGIANMTPPDSLVSLFTPHKMDRRMSLRPTPTTRRNYAASRRASLASVPTPTPPPMNRRMSLRPAPLSRLPPASSRRGSLHPANRRFSLRPATGTLPPPSSTPPSSPPSALHLMAPHLFQRPMND